VSKFSESHSLPLQAIIILMIVVLFDCMFEHYGNRSRADIEDLQDQMKTLILSFSKQ
jgi:hypothetical protein